MKTYVTFGQTHVHSINGKTFDKDSIAVIEAKDSDEGRSKTWEYFGSKFFTTYSELQWKEDEQLSWFPRGYINVNF